MTNLNIKVNLTSRNGNPAILLAIDLENKKVILYNVKDAKEKTVTFLTAEGYKVDCSYLPPLKSRYLTAKTLKTILDTDKLAPQKFTANLTSKEAKMMNAITEDQFYENGTDSVLWLDNFIEYCGFEGKAAGGILTSLQEKGYIYIQLEDDGNLLGLTDKGADYLNSLNKPAEPKKQAPNRRPTKPTVKEEEVPQGTLTTVNPDNANSKLMYIEDLASIVGLKAKTLRKRLRTLVAEGTVVKVNHTWCWDSTSIEWEAIQELMSKKEEN